MRSNIRLISISSEKDRLNWLSDIVANSENRVFRKHNLEYSGWYVTGSI